MARTKISEFSSTAADNTDIDGIDIAEGCAPSGINNAIRTLMADLKDMQTGASGDTFTFASLNATTANIDGGTIDGATIGGSSAAPVSSTNLAYTGTLTGGTGVINIGSGQLYKDASGNVGIGLTSLSSTFTVQGTPDAGTVTFKHAGNNAYGTILTLETTGGVDAPSLSFKNHNGGSPAYYGVAATSAGDLTFNAGAYSLSYGTERMRLTSSGSLGIGVTPNQKLDVDGNIQIRASNSLNFLNTSYFIRASTGFEFQTPDFVRFLTGGANERFRIDSLGNIGVGATSNLTAKINFPTSDYGEAINYYSNASEQLRSGVGKYTNETRHYVGVGTDAFAWRTGGPNGTERMRLTQSGDLGLGDTVPTVKLTVAQGKGTTYGKVLKLVTAAAIGAGSDGPQINFLNVGVGQWGVGMAPSDSTDFVFSYGGSDSSFGSEFVRIKSSGQMLVGTSGYIDSIESNTFYRTNTDHPTVNIVHDGNANVSPLRIKRYPSDGDAITFFFGNTQKGYVAVTSTGTTYSTLSDYRLKENVKPMQGALAKVALLNPVTYDWINLNKAGQGFIAHELQAVVPECVTGNKDEVDENGNPRYQGVDTSFLVATLTAAIQEQQAIINSLQDRITLLEQAK